MVEPDRVRSKLGRLEEYLRGLDEKRTCTRTQYRSDRDLQDIVERRFEKAVQASLDIAAHVVSSEGFREPRNYGDLFVILGEEGILDEKTKEEMTEMAGFRNVLAHDYADIVDDRVYDHLQDISRFRRFAVAIDEYLETVDD